MYQLTKCYQLSKHYLRYEAAQMSIFLGLTVLLGQWDNYGGDGDWWQLRLYTRIN